MDLEIHSEWTCCGRDSFLFTWWVHRRAGLSKPLSRIRQQYLSGSFFDWRFQAHYLN